MNSEIFPEDVQTALDRCGSEPVHIPGVIQAHGAVIAVENERLIITHASENLSDITGMYPSEVLGQRINDVLPKGIRHDFTNGLLPAFLNQNTRLLESVTLNDNELFASASNAVDRTVFEFEPISIKRNVTGSVISQIAFLTAQLQGIDSKEQLFKKCVSLLQVLTGYQRIMVYEFDDEGNGTVQAEALSGRLEPFLGLQFPAWDIPQQARQIMRKTPLRYIGDVSAEPVRLLAATDEQDALDMTFSHLRGVSSVHMRYLENMGTQSTFTLNIVVDGELWGMISMHNSVPRVPDQSLREVCRNFIRLFELSLDSILQRERLARLHDANALRKRLMAEASNASNATMFDEQMLDGLRDAMRADGALLAKDGRVIVAGHVPSDNCLTELIAYGEEVEDTFYSHSVAKDCPELSHLFGHDVAGVHITPMRENCFVAFFRKDRERETTWAGTPEKTIVGTGPDARLNPRGSFAAFKQTVRGTSAPWTIENHQLAKDVWSILVSSERSALIRQTTRQQKLVIDELNHRVRNILTLIRSLSRQSHSTADTIEGFVETLEARIEAVANAHSLAVEKPEAFVSVHSILKMEAQPHNISTTRVFINGDDIGMRPDMAPVFALIIHELMTNAAKYGCLSQLTGRLTITLTARADGLSLHWHEQSGPPVQPPTRQGFGSTLLDNAVPNELGGAIDRDYAHDGLQVHLRLPHKIFGGARYLGRDDAGQAPSPKPSVTTSIPRGELRCMLLEDSFVVSMDTVRVMNEAGLDNIQTAMTVPEAQSILDTESLDFAVVDVNLSAGQTSFGIARRLADQGVPFIFVTGYGVDGAPRDVFPNVGVLSKPLRRSELETALEGLSL